MARSSCVNAKDEVEAAPTRDIALASGTAAYVINDNSLTIASGPLMGTYTH